MSNKSCAQTLHILEQAADTHRIGSCMYMHAVEKLKGDIYSVHGLLEQPRKHSQIASPIPHIKLLKRITEPGISERLHIWYEEQEGHSLNS